MISQEVMFTMRLPFEFVERKKWFLACCPILDVHSQGNTQAEAKKNLKEALQLFLMSCFERGTLDSVLKECGFTPVSLEEHVPVPRKDYINIHLPMLVNKTRAHHCHV